MPSGQDVGMIGIEAAISASSWMMISPLVCCGTPSVVERFARHVAVFISAASILARRYLCPDMADTLAGVLRGEIFPCFTRTPYFSNPQSGLDKAPA